MQSDADDQPEHDERDDHGDVDPLRDPRTRAVVGHVPLVIDIGRDVRSFTEAGRLAHTTRMHEPAREGRGVLSQLAAAIDEKRRDAVFVELVQPVDDEADHAREPEHANDDECPDRAVTFSHRRDRTLFAMQRVVIVGPGGAGKSWLAKRIAERTGLPLIHLDREYWRPGWVETPKPEWRARVAELVARDRWVIDGNYGGTLATRMDRADTIIFLDVSRWASLAGVLVRRLRTNQRDDISDGCPERLNLEFLRWLWRYHDHHRPNVLEQIGAHAHGRTVITLRDRAAISAFAAGA